MRDQVKNAAASHIKKSMLQLDDDDLEIVC
jgi:hypothetical protein